MFPFLNLACFFQAGNGTGSHLLKLHYLDRLLQENMTGVAVCENAAPSPPPAAALPLVTCTATHVTVKLPGEAKLKKVKTLSKNQISTHNFSLLITI